MKKKKQNGSAVRKAGLFLGRIIAGLFLLSIFVVILFRFMPVPVTPLMLIRCAEQVNAGEDLRLKKDWEPFEKISEHLHLAVVCAEDQNFPKHNGFDFEAIQKAMEHNQKSARKRGASTISQQTAKNLFLWPSRSWIRKGLEAYFTVLIELFWSKERILEVYLNIIEFGPGIYGAEAAAQEFFNTPAANLTKAQAALLAAVLPSPLKYSAKSPGPYVRSRQAWILTQMHHWDFRLILNKEEEKAD